MWPVIRIVVIATATVACIAGCATVKSIAKLASPEQPPPVETSPSDPLADFVGTAPLGQAVDYSGGSESLTIRVVSAYSAASGRKCRSFVATDRSGSGPQRVVCLVDGGWTEIQPLVQDSSNAPAATVP